MSNEQTIMIQNNLNYNNININTKNSIQKMSFQSHALQSPQHQSFQMMQSPNIKKPEYSITASPEFKGDQFMFPSLSMMDTINEDNINHFRVSKHTYTPSPLSSLNETPTPRINSYLYSIINTKSGDNEIVSRDIEIAGLPTDDHPSLHPRYTNETSISSSIGTTSARSSANSAKLGLNQTSSFYYTKENLPKIICKKNHPLSSELIYDNMNKFQSQHTKQPTLDEHFTMIEDDEDDDFESDRNGDGEVEEEIYYPTETEFVSDYDEYDEYDGALELESDLIAPSIDINNLLITENQNNNSPETQYQIEYDAEGDHNTSIPVEFRTLQLSTSFGADNEFGMFCVNPLHVIHHITFG